MDRLDLLLAIDRWGSLFLGLSALSAPFALPVFALLRARHRAGSARPGAAAAWGCLTALVYSPLALIFAVCHGVYVGDPPRARIGFHWAEPVIAGLERYRADVGTYPESLAVLIPRYLSDPAALTLPTRGDFSGGPTYRRDSAGYTLAFEYHGPGVNTCRYTPAVRQWSCSGYF